jgi:predicted DNA-binding transcriptional regulator AlpA
MRPTAVDHLLLTHAEVAQLLRVSPRTLDRMRQEGTVIPPVKLNRQLRWLKSELIEWLQAGCPKVGR